MNIILNGTTETAPEQITLAQFIERLDLTGKRYAVEINERLVPHSQHAEYKLHEDDKIEVVQAIGGG